MSVIRGLAKTIFAAGDLLLTTPGGPRLLIYHQVGVGLGRQMEVTTDNFEKQMAWLHREREVVDIDTSLRRWSKPGSERLIVLTFDDGYRDLYSTAYPVLRSYDMPFVVYLATDLVDPRGQDGAGLTWDHLAEMHASGLMTLGSHTRSHPDLRYLTHDQVEDELGSSDETITRELGIGSRHFAYPYGFWSETADAAVRSRYESAVLGGAPRPASAPDPYLLHRYPVQLSDGFVFFTMRVKRGLRFEEVVRRRMKGYTGP